MSKNKTHKKISEHTPKKIKQYAIIWFIASILFIISGISSFVEDIANGFLLVGLGILFFVISRRYFNIAKEKEKAEQERCQEIEKKEKIEKERLETERKNIEKFIRENDTKTYHVAGISYYEKNIMNFAQENYFYDMTKKELIEEYFSEDYLENERIYEYDFCVSKFEIVPEPDNPYDKNAIKVLADGVQIGHIKAGSCSHLLNVIKENRLTKIEGEIKGGKYKYICYDDETEKYLLKKDKIPFYAKLEISEKKKLIE